MIEVRDLRKSYGPTVAVGGLSFDVRPGRVTGFLGPNGAGKSTTMRLILGLDAPTGGEVKVNGRPYARHRFPMHEVGTLLDAQALHPGRRAANHLMCLADSNRIPRRRVDEVLDFVGLADAASRRVGPFSLGMKQRLGIAGALLGDPPILLFDEPVTGLDPEGILWIRNLFHRLAEEGRTVLVSSHLLGEVEQICDRVGVISNGHLVTQSTVQELLGEEGVLVRAQPIEQAQEILTRMFGTAAVSRQDGAIHLKTKPENSANINRQLMNAGVGVSELRPFERSLEEVFFQLTGEKQGS